MEMDPNATTEETNFTLSENTSNVNLTSAILNQEAWETFSIEFEFVVHGVMLCTVGLLGLLGNVVSIIVLSRPQMKSSINTLLIGLVSCDSILVMTSIFLFSFTVFRHMDDGSIFSWYYWHIYPYILPVVYPVGLIAQTGSVYMTLGITIER